MLVLSRRKGQTVLIGEDCRIKILKIRRDKVDIGFDAPPNVPIVRAELIEDHAGGVRPTTGSGGTEDR